MLEDWKKFSVPELRGIISGYNTMVKIPDHRGMSRAELVKIVDTHFTVTYAPDGSHNIKNKQTKIEIETNTQAKERSGKKEAMEVYKQLMAKEALNKEVTKPKTPIKSEKTKAERLKALKERLDVLDKKIPSASALKDTAERLKALKDKKIPAASAASAPAKKTRAPRSDKGMPRKKKEKK